MNNVPAIPKIRGFFRRGLKLNKATIRSRLNDYGYFLGVYDAQQVLNRCVLRRAIKASRSSVLIDSQMLVSTHGFNGSNF